MAIRRRISKRQKKNQIVGSDDDKKVRRKDTNKNVKSFSFVDLRLIVVFVTVLVLVFGQLSGLYNKKISNSLKTRDDDEARKRPRGEEDESVKGGSRGKRTDAELQKPRVKDTLMLGDDSFKVIGIFDHDRKAFTQGLTWFNGFLYEGTGLNGSSEVRKLDPSNPSKAIMAHSIPSKFFGEGITYYSDKEGNDRILQLTWQEKTGFIYDANTFEIIKEFQYETSNGEGWGITFIPTTCEFVVSDGSHNLMFWDCESLHEIRRVQVNYYRNSKPTQIKMLNELEALKLTDGNYSVLANVWYQDVMLQINPSNGYVEKIYYFKSLHKSRESGEDVFNGISVCDDNENIIFLTGKLWSKIYKVELLR